MTRTWLRGVVSGGVLHGLTLDCATPLTILVDVEPDAGRVGAAAHALRVLAGIEVPRSGEARALGADPAHDPALRRRIALLGDDALLPPGDDDLLSTGDRLARARGVSIDRASLAELEGATLRRALADRVANDAAASLLLVSHPERYLAPGARDAVLARARAALDRGAQVVIATRRLDEVLAFAPDDRASAAVIARGVVTAVSPAHALPWALGPEGVATRIVRVVVEDAPERAIGESARLASELLADPEIAPRVASVEPLDRSELRVAARDPRAVVRAIARRAKDGLEVRALVVLSDVAGGLR